LGGGEFKRLEGMKRFFSRVDSLMPLTWERKGGGGGKERWDKNEADRGNKREEKERRERKRGRVGKNGFLLFTYWCIQS
jgi:hypothetical protein